MLEAKRGSQHTNLPWDFRAWFYSQRVPKPNFKRVFGEHCRRSGFAQLHFQLTSLIQKYLAGNTGGWYRNLWNFRKKNPFCFQLKILSTESRDKCRWTRTKKLKKRKFLGILPQMQEHNSLSLSELLWFLRLFCFSQCSALPLPITQHTWLWKLLHMTEISLLPGTAEPLQTLHGTKPRWFSASK